MKKPIHFYGPSKVHTYTTICGLALLDNYKDTIYKKNVTCKTCIKIMNKEK